MKKNDNLRTVFGVIAALSGQANVLTIPKIFINIFGEIETALVFSQMIYWSDRGKDGWFYKTYEEWREELGIKEWKMRQIIGTFRGMNLIETDFRKVGDTPKLHFRIKMDGVVEKITSFIGGEIELEGEETSESENSDPANIEGSYDPANIEGSDPTKTAATLNTETTVTEITTETTLAGDSKEEIQNSPEEYFAMIERNREARGEKAEPITSTSYKERLASAIESFERRRLEGNADVIVAVENYVGKLPENIRELARVYCMAVERTPTKGENSFWIKGWMTQCEIGLSSGDIQKAIQEMQKENLTIKSPQSVTAIAEKHKQSRSRNPFMGLSMQ